MYLARRRIKGKTRYFIAESFEQAESGLYLHRDLFDLGMSPAEYLLYHSRYCYSVDPAVEDTLQELGAVYAPGELDNLFWPFVKPEIRYNLESISCRKSYYRPHQLSEEEKERLRKEIHLFDKQRMYYLRYGNLDQTRIGRVPLKLFRILLDKSRDEIEQYILAMEQILLPDELKKYVFVIFNLQRFFTNPNASILPYVLDQNKLDDCFLQEICALDSDARFWSGVEKTSGLNEYLTRYAIMFFDYNFAGFSPWEDYIRDFMGRHRAFRFPDTDKTATIEEASTVFGVAAETLKSMDKNELTKLYRRKAHSLHPDKGGEHEAFVELTKIYKELLKSKK